jgi:hypothetical protein
MEFCFANLNKEKMVLKVLEIWKKLFDKLNLSKYTLKEWKINLPKNVVYIKFCKCFNKQ